MKIPAIHREGYRFIAIFAGATALLFWLAGPVGWIGVVLTLWCIYFFRDPEREIPNGKNFLLAPADGVICDIREVSPPAELALGQSPLTRVSIFMNVFNVHVNRAPVIGRIAKIHYIPGKFFNASLDKASEANERQLFRIEPVDGPAIGMVQIAGLVARRIVRFVDEGAEVQAGERIGLIRFGSRVDTYLPLNSSLQVNEGDKTIAGETILAEGPFG